MLVRPAVLISMFAALLACGTRAERNVSGVEDVESAIRASVAAYNRAALAGQVDSFAALFTDDAILLPPNGPAARGREGARSVLSPLAFTELRNAALEIESRDDVAIARGAFAGTFRIENAATPVRDTGKWVAVWHRQPDGKWLIAMNIWNSDLPLTSSATPTRR